MAFLLAEPRLAFVQARLDYRNRERNMLTRAQALELDTFLAYEQAAARAFTPGAVEILIAAVVASAEPHRAQQADRDHRGNQG